jgi:predicted Fe-Mo cluster-binding NifX family protein
MTKVAVTSEGPALTDMVDPRFGRAGGFIVIDPETMEHKYVDNGSSQAMAHGAGIQAAQLIADSGAKVVLTGFVGPKAFDALRAVGIKVVQNLDNMSVKEAVEKYKSGDTDYAAQPNK